MIAGFIDWALSPLNWLLVAFVLLVAGYWTRARRVAFVAGTALAGLAFAVMTPVVSNALARRLERAVEVPASCAVSPPDVVVVLAGGVDRLPRRDTSFGVLSATSRRRIERGVEHWQGAPGRSIVMTGGPTASGWVPHAALMGTYAQALGVPSQAITLETASRTTWENARHVAALQPAIPRRIALSTSAMHMRRSVVAFRAAGFDVCPLPADRRAVRAGLPGGLIPDAPGLAKAEDALHEMVGNIHYRWLVHRGRSAR